VIGPQTVRVDQIRRGPFWPNSTAALYHPFDSGALGESIAAVREGPVLRCAEPRSCETIRRRKQKDRRS
jgi:hypothetical protein